MKKTIIACFHRYLKPPIVFFDTYGGQGLMVILSYG